MNIFEQFANKAKENNNNKEVPSADINEPVFDEEGQTRIAIAISDSYQEEENQIDNSIDLVDDGKGNLMMHIPGEPAEIVKQNEAKDKAKEDNDKKKKKKDKVEVKSLKEKGATKTAYELIEEKLVKYPKIIVKVFSEKLYEYDNPDEIKMLKIEDITNNLIVEHDYEEFSNGVNWNLSPNADKTIGYLIPTYKFQPKG